MANKKLKNNTHILNIFGNFINNYPKHFLLLFLLILCEGLLAGFSMLAIIPMADYLLDPSLFKISKITNIVINLFLKLNIKPSFFSFGSLFIFSNLFKGIIEVGVRYAILKIKYDVTQNLISDSLEMFFKAKWGFFSNTNNGILLNTLTKELSTISDTLGHIATLLAQIIQVLIFLSVPLWLNFNLTIMVLGSSILLGLPFLLLNKLIYKLGKKNTESGNNAMGVLSEILQSTRIILGFGMQKKSKNYFIEQFKIHIKFALLSQVLTTAIPKFFQPLAMAAVVTSIGFSLKKNTPISELTAIMWSFLGALPILTALLQGKISLNNFIPSYEQLTLLQNKANEYKEIEGTLVFKSLTHGIELNSLNFEYPTRKNTLVNINLKINKGEMTALIGDSGSGKSTITDLILGLQTPTSGLVLINGISLSKYVQNSFRQRIGYVPQDPILFDCSIKDNLLWANENATIDELRNVLKLANADKFVLDLPHGIDTFVGNRGIRLSGGQRQRIALARALIRKPDLLILDEATSALDTESEQLIQNSIENVAKQTTILVIAHRLSTISKANQVYILKSGKIIENGTFDYLSNSTGSELNNMLKMQLLK
jgi:ABC-type multidrug transport system fused ATPase/permease subunit